MDYNFSVLTRSRFLTIPIFMILAGILLHGEPGDPDAEYSLFKLFGLILIFFYFSLAFSIWGRILKQISGLKSLPIVFDFLFGACFVILFTYAFSYTGLLGYKNSYILWCTSLIAFPIEHYLRSNGSAIKYDYFSEYFSVIKSWRYEWVPVIIVLILFTKASIPNSGYDPLYYHLLAPRLWAQSGKLNWIENHPIIFQSGSWEYTYLWFHSLFTSSNGVGLISGQILSQWVHLIWGLGASLAMVWHILGRFSWSPLLRCTALTGLIFNQLESWTAIQAKNDWGLFFLYFGAIALLLKKSKKSLLLAGLLCGLAFTGKWSHILSWMLSYLFLSLTVWKGDSPKVRWKSFLYVLAGFTTGAAPVIARNLIFTGNPFFPFAENIFNSGLVSPSLQFMISYPNAIGGQLNWAVGLAQFFIALLSSFPLNWLTLFWIAYIILTRRINSESKIFYPLVMIYASVLVFSIFISDPVALRQIGALSIILPIITAFIIMETVEKVNPKWKWLVLPLFIICGIFASVKFKTMPDGFPGYMNPTKAARMVNNGDLKAWLRQNVSPSEKIAVSGMLQLYYISHLNVTVLDVHAILEKKILELDDPVQLIKFLNKEGFRYFVHSLEPNKKSLNGFTSSWLHPFILRFSKSIKFSGRNGSVVDLEVLLQEIEAPESLESLNVLIKNSLKPVPRWKP